MYKTILVPLDGSERAEAIMPHVQDLARRYEAGVILLQVVEPMRLIIGPHETLPDWNPGLLELLAKDAETYLTGWQEQVKQLGLEARMIVELGPVVETIIKVAKREGADLIAMASHGRTGLAWVFYGSVAAGVLHRVDRPLLLIRSQNST